MQLRVNGVVRQYTGDPEMPLLWYLRDLLQLTGTKISCGIGVCGTCTVHVNGKATRSCADFSSARAKPERFPLPHGHFRVGCCPANARSRRD